MNLNTKTELCIYRTFQLLGGSMKTSTLSSLSTIWVNSPISMCILQKSWEKSCVQIWDKRNSAIPLITYTHLHLSVTLHMSGTERTKYAHQLWTRQAHCAHQVLTAELWKFLPFACYEIWMHLSTNQKWNPSKNQAFSWLKSTAITIESLQIEVKKICHRSVWESVKTKGNISAGAKSLDMLKTYKLTQTYAKMSNIAWNGYNQLQRAGPQSSPFFAPLLSRQSIYPSTYQ